MFHLFTLPLLLAFAVDRPAEPLLDQVDVVELNHFYDEHGKHVFDQLIFYDWCNCAGRFQVRAWRLVKTDTKGRPTQLSQLPRFDRDRQLWVCAWTDGLDFRQVRATSRRETWTQQDPELLERPFLPKELRRELSRPRPRNSLTR